MSVSTVRVVDLETTGSRPPAHAVCEIGWQDVTLGEDGWQVTASRGSSLVDPQRAIPPVTQAVHHIIDEDVVGAPRWADIAPVVLRAFPVMAAHRASFEQRFCTPALSGGARWICTWKCALRLWPDSPSFSNQVLRYWRKPVGLDRELGLPVHRALPDAYVTAHHLRDMLAEASVDQLLEWSDLPGLLPRVPAGPDRGKGWAEIDDAALTGWLGDRDEDVRYSASVEQARRSGTVRDVAPPSQGSLFA
ncbi:3'-5' exonuclease [Glacieibacterium frigidum]|uniref:3'-5' exonuclease n=1 Tax=Glacieibacterium frigidum TaxID=2593303 RepID=A0A552UFC7_9SPHN|nr:3'-5' exonuclease [Glacieibacterium frigidum]TRW16926.1 3'-5' exonuclease [Glacieibacterium frigidum]